MAIDRLKGRVLWERVAPTVKTKVVDKRNNPASPSPAVDETGAYVFFPDYGLIAYDAAGKERWTMPLGPFTNIYGMGASPIVVGDLLILACDQSVGSYIMAIDKKTGRVVWKTDRPEAKSGHSTPVLWRAPDGKDQILLPGSFLLTAYEVATGKKIWWVGGLSFEMKSTPVIGGDTIYANGYGAPVNDPGNKITVPSADSVWPTADTNADGVLSKSEFPKFTPAFWFEVADLDQNGSLTKDEWAYYRAALDSENGMLAIRLGGSGDMSDKGDPLEVPAHGAPVAVAAPLRRRALHDQRQRDRDDAESRDRRDDQAGTPDWRAWTALRVAGRRRRAHLLHERSGRSGRRGARWRHRAALDQRSRRGRIRDARDRRRPDLRADRVGVVRVRRAALKRCVRNTRFFPSLVRVRRFHRSCPASYRGQGRSVLVTHSVRSP
jgi:outer membrane protein assembly factor BamB